MDSGSADGLRRWTPQMDSADGLRRWTPQMDSADGQLLHFSSHVILNDLLDLLDNFPGNSNLHNLLDLLDNFPGNSSSESHVILDDLLDEFFTPARTLYWTASPLELGVLSKWTNSRGTNLKPHAVTLILYSLVDLPWPVAALVLGLENPQVPGLLDVLQLMVAHNGLILSRQPQNPAIAIATYWTAWWTSG